MHVWPKNEIFRKALKHPTGVGFRETGSADWPNDAFTGRLLGDGDVLDREPVKSVSPSEHRPDPKSAPKA